MMTTYVIDLSNGKQATCLAPSERDAANAYAQRRRGRTASATRIYRDSNGDGWYRLELKTYRTGIVYRVRPQ